MKLQLKRSSVLDSGSAKAPTAGQMEYGELAVNYNTADVQLFIKDSDNNVVSVTALYAPLASPAFTGTVTGPTINASTALQIGGVAITSTAAELNILDGVTATAAELNILDGVTATAAELNILDGVTATNTELNYSSGVTSGIQNQIDAKAPKASPAFTGDATLTGDLTINTDALFVDASEKEVGIGTTSPTNLLHIAADANAEGILIKSTGDTYNVLDFDANRSAAESGLGNIRGYWNGTKVAQIALASGSDTTNKDDGIIQFSTSSSNNITEVMRIDSSGRLLVGTSSDLSGGTTSTALQVSTIGGGYLGLARNDASLSSGNAIGGLRFYANDPSGYNDVGIIQCVADGTHGTDDYPTRLQFHTTANGADHPSERMQIDSSGRVGIGTTSPDSPLQVGVLDSPGTLRAGLTVKTVSNDLGNSEAAIYLEESSGGEGYYLRVDSYGGLAFDNSAQTTPTLYLSDTNNVGIGTSSPSGLLHISGDVCQLHFTDEDDSSSSRIYQSGATFAIDVDQADTKASSVFAIRTDDQERMRIDSSGNVGINITPPTILSSNTKSVFINDRAAIVGWDGLLDDMTSLTNNFYYNSSGNNIIIEDGWANKLDLRDGTLRYSVSTALGTAGGTTSVQEKLRIDSKGRLLVGTTSEISANNPSIQLVDDSTAVLVLARNDSSITTGNALGAIEIYGNDGGTYQMCASIAAQADGSHSNTSKPSRLVFSTTADGATTPTDHFQLSSGGDLTVNNILNVREAIDLADNDVLRFGTGDDVQMVHDGSHFYIKLLANDDLIITDEDNSVNAFRFDSSARRLYVTDNIYAGFNMDDYNGGSSNHITTYCRDGANQTDTWTSYAALAADYRSVANEATTEYTYHFISEVKDQAGNRCVVHKLDVTGAQWGLGSQYAGRTQSTTTSTPTNYYWRSNNGSGFHSYNGRPVDSGKLYATANRAYVKMTAVFEDADDRKALYGVKSDTDGTSDYDQDQYLSCSAMGRFGVKGSIQAGRVESDEANPNTIYAPVGWGGGAGIAAYTTNSNCYSAITGRATANTDYIFKARVNATSDKVRIEANGEAYTDGAWNNSPADYAEYFEWEDGNPTGEDRRGLPVVLVQDGKIRVATAEDDSESIIGVISAHPAFVGDAAELSWHGTYEKDSFGKPVEEDELWLIWNKEYKDGVPVNQPIASDPNTWGASDGFPLSDLPGIEKAMADGVQTGIPRWAIDQNCVVNKPKQIISSAYDPSKVYIPRSKRKEWDTVGLIGKLPVAKGSPIGSRWIKMGEITNGLDRYFVR